MNGISAIIKDVKQALQMLYFVQGNNIIFKDNSGEIKCSDLGILSPLEKISSSFRQKDSYKEAVSLISHFLPTENLKTLILTSSLFCHSGFVNSLKDTLGPGSKVISHLEFALNSQNLEDGQYSFIDLSENECYSFDFAVANGITCIAKRSKLNTERLKQLLATKFSSNQIESLYGSITNYNNLAEAIQYLNAYVSDEYDCYTLSDITLGEQFKDIYFSALFDGLSETVLDFIAEHNQNNRPLLLLTPLAAFQPVTAKLNSKRKLVAMSVFDLVSQTPSDKKYIRSSEDFEVAAYPSNKTSTDSISSWILSETNKLSFELHSTLTNSIQINLDELKKELSSSSFFVQGKEVVKYFIQIQRDTYFNLHLKIDTLDNKEFYYLINS